MRARALHTFLVLSVVPVCWHLQGAWELFLKLPADVQPLSCIATQLPGLDSTVGRGQAWAHLRLFPPSTHEWLSEVKAETPH